MWEPTRDLVKLSLSMCPELDAKRMQMSHFVFHASAQSVSLVGSLLWFGQLTQYSWNTMYIHCRCAQTERLRGAALLFVANRTELPACHILAAWQLIWWQAVVTGLNLTFHLHRGLSVLPPLFSFSDYTLLLETCNFRFRLKLTRFFSKLQQARSVGAEREGNAAAFRGNIHCTSCLAFTEHVGKKCSTKNTEIN